MDVVPLCKSVFLVGWIIVYGDQLSRVPFAVYASYAVYDALVRPLSREFFVHHTLHFLLSVYASTFGYHERNARPLLYLGLLEVSSVVVNLHILLGRRHLFPLFRVLFVGYRIIMHTLLQFQTCVVEGYGDFVVRFFVVLSMLMQFRWALHPKIGMTVLQLTAIVAMTPAIASMSKRLGVW